MSPHGNSKIHYSNRVHQTQGLGLITKIWRYNMKPSDGNRTWNHHSKTPESNQSLNLLIGFTVGLIKISYWTDIMITTLSPSPEKPSSRVFWRNSLIKLYQRKWKTSQDALPLRALNNQSLCILSSECNCRPFSWPGIYKFFNKCEVCCCAIFFFYIFNNFELKS